jgi:hypothetical protein
MHKRKSLVSLLMSLVFVTGMIAPVPECYVTRLVCPAKTSGACQGVSTATVGDPSPSAPCCQVIGGRLASEASLACVGSRHQVKTYVPDLENVEAPVLPVVLALTPFHVPLVSVVLSFSFHDVFRHDRPDPIPILQKKQSLLI